MEILVSIIKKYKLQTSNTKLGFLKISFCVSVRLTNIILPSSSNLSFINIKNRGINTKDKGINF